jgi:hypothetical protein
MPTTNYTIRIAPDVSGDFVDFVTLDTTAKRQSSAVGDSENATVVARVLTTEPAPTDAGQVVRPLRYVRTLKHFVAAATNNATSLKATSGAIYRVHIYSAATYPVYVKFWNKASAPAPASDSALLVCTVGCQAGQTRDYIPDDGGISFSTGIGYAVVKGMADNDNVAVAASDCVVQIAWL